MSVRLSDLQEYVAKLGAALDSECTLVAAGGTALTFARIKGSTKDIDFVVEEGSMPAVESAVSRISPYRVDLFPSGKVFNNPLPPNYLSRATYVGRFSTLKVFAMHPLDVTMTKIARADAGDISDIRLCAGHGQTVNDILGAAVWYGIDTPELRNNLRAVLREVYGIDMSEAEGDLR